MVLVLCFLCLSRPLCETLVKVFSKIIFIQIKESLVVYELSSFLKLILLISLPRWRSLVACGDSGSSQQSNWARKEGRITLGRTCKRCAPAERIRGDEKGRMGRDETGRRREGGRHRANRCGRVFPRQECEDSRSQLSSMSHNSRSGTRPHTLSAAQTRGSPLLPR